MRTLAACLAAAALLTGCEAEQICTGIGTPVGVGVTVKAPLAGQVRDAELEICWSGSCRRPGLELFPSTAASGQTCTGDTCSAVMEPTGDKHGFAGVEGLPKSPVRVRLTLRDAGGDELLDRTLQVTPKGRFPNGPKCGEGGPNAQLVAEPGAVREG
ncbi:hypothetical protein [Nonomuraea sp. LPB2021202275-12-8]|uniref:hypothetical protein n=1 Tax=Nonomuraea sp. LPB2021202275-12-8 TaxID=3120159 RepID=UPI00300D7B59